MDSKRWQELDRVFHRAAELSGEDRNRYLNESCGDAPELRAHVERLLAFDDDPSTSFVDESPIGSGSATRASSDSPQDRYVGSRVGAYRLLNRLAEGGMGVVYRARRDDDLLNYVVAVKLVRGGMHDEQILNRFHTERQTLADLDHPFIARLLDGGATEEGVPYLVMEYVEGEPLDLYCDNRRLTVRQRLKLFRTVCEAVQYAHQNLVVHRDLKPSNILVNNSGVPKLLDFGIAKVLADGPLHPIAQTVTAARMLTPDFASPEQIRGLPVTTATDIYSLGVVLYRLLTGRRPYRLTGAGIDEIHRAVCEQDPTIPSTAVLRLKQNEGDADREPQSPADLAAFRRTATEKLRRELRGDLDNIVMMALRKDPVRRYVSVEQFSSDIGRYLDSIPVVARKDTIVYRTKMFVRRNRVIVGSAVTVVVAIVAALVVALQAAREASLQRDAARLAEQRANHEAIHARIEADSSTEIANFMVQMLDAATVHGGEGHQTAIAGLRHEAGRIRRQFADNPHLQANLIDGIGQVLMSLREFDLAEEFMEEAKTLRYEEFGDHSLEMARSLNSLGELAFDRGKYATAVELFRRSLRLHEQLPVGVHTDVGEAANNLAVALRAVGELDESESLHRQALAARRSASRPSGPAVAESLNNIAGIYISQAKYDDASSALREALSIRKRDLGEQHPLVAQTVANLAVTLHQAGRFEEAESLYREAAELQRAVPGTDEEGLATTLTTLGDLLRTVKKFDEAMDVLGEALDILERRFGSDHLRVALVRAQMARALYIQNQYDSARTQWDEVIRIRRLALPEDHILIGSALNDFGMVLTKMRDFDVAERALREAVRIYESSAPENSWHKAVVSACLGECLLEQGRTDEAKKVLSGSLEALKKWRGEDARETLRAAQLLARANQTESKP